MRRILTGTVRGSRDYISWALIILSFLIVLGAIVALIYFAYHPERFADAASGIHDVGKTFLHIESWDWVAVLVAVMSLFFAGITFASQHETEKNTMKITPESQRQILKDLIRHYYRNYIIILALERKISGRLRDYYPSEEHLLKLAVNLDDLHPAAFYNQVENYQRIHNLMMMMRNFNTELGTVTKHLCSPDVPEEAKLRDFATLKFKMGMLAQRTYEAILTMWPDKSWAAYIKEMREACEKRLGRNHGCRECSKPKFPYPTDGKNFEEVQAMLKITAEGYNKEDMAELKTREAASEETAPYLADRRFYTGKGDFFSFFFPEAEAAKNFGDMTNRQIFIEYCGPIVRRDPNSVKIFLIPFDPAKPCISYEE